MSEPSVTTPEGSLGWVRHSAIGVAPLMAVGMVALLVAVIARQPWMVPLAAVPLVVLVLEAIGAPPPVVSIDTTLDRTSVTEGTELDFDVRLTSDRAGHLEVRYRPIGSAVLSRSAASVDLAAGGEAETSVSFTCTRWGRAGIELSSLTWSTPLGLVRWTAHVGIARRTWVRPNLPRLRGRLGVSETTRRPGLHTARVRGAGVEYHSSRPYQPGDRWRDIDHRTSARRRSLWTTTRHGEHAREVFIVADLVADDVPADGETHTVAAMRLDVPTLADHVVRASDAIARDHIAERDRVGLAVLGSHTIEIAAAEGDRHHQRLVAALMRAEARVPGFVPRSPDLRPMTDSRATVVIVSPLFDRAIVEAALELRRHGGDVVVVRVGSDLVEPWRRSEVSADRDAAALRLVTEGAYEDRLRAHGITVTSAGLTDDVHHSVELAMTHHRRSITASRRRR